MAAAPPSLGPPTFGLLNSSDGKVSEASLDIDAFLDSMLMRDPIGLGTELVPSTLAQGLGLATTDGLFGQQGSNDRKVGSGTRHPPLAPRPGAATPTNGLGVSGSVPQSAAPKAPNAGPEGPSVIPGAEVDPGDPEMALAARNQAAAAGAAAAQAAYAHQQQAAATAAAMAAQAYSHQQAAYAQQTQQAAAAAAAAAQPAASQRAYMQQAQQAQQAQAQHAAYMQAYQQQAAAYAASQYPPGANGMWMSNPYGAYGAYGGQSYYTPQQYMQYSAQYGASAMPSSATAQQAAAAAAAAAMPAPAPVKVEPRPGVAGAGVEGGGEGAGEEDEEEMQALKRPRLIWTPQLHRRFLESVERCGGLDHALPKSILKEMGMSDLTRENVASHLQKYRMKLKRDEEDAAAAGVDVGVDAAAAGSPKADERDGKRRKKGGGSSREATPAVNNAEGDGEAVAAAVGAVRRTRRTLAAANVANNSAGEA